MVLTLDYLRNTFLRDLPLADQYGRPLPDTVLTTKAQSVQAAFQRRYGVRLERSVVKMGDVPLRVTLPDLPLVQKDAEPYDPRGFEGDRFVSLSLPVGPVRQVLAVGLKLPGSAVIEWPGDWVQLQRRARIIQIYPGGQIVNLMPIQASAFGMQALMGGRAIPNAWQVAYEAGYSQEDLQGDDADVLTALGMLTAIAVLIPGSLDGFAARGISGLSASVDGLSNSTQLAGGGQTLRFAPFIQAYKDELTTWEKTYQDRGLGLRFGVL